MKIAIKILRLIIVAILLLAVGLPTVFYMLLSTDWAQERLRIASEQAIEKLLGADAEIDNIGLSPFNRLWLENVTINDDNGAPALNLGRVETRVEMYDLLLKRQFIIDYVSINGLEANVYKETKDSPLNIAGIIAKLSGSGEKKDKHFSLRLNDVSIANGSLNYSVVSEPQTPGKFNPSHIQVNDLTVAVFSRVLSSDTISATLQRLSFNEASGLTLKNLGCRFGLSPKGITINGLNIELPQTRLTFADTHVVIDGFAQLSQIGRSIPAEIEILDGSHIYLPDLASFMPNLDYLKQNVQLAMSASGTIDSLQLDNVSIRDRSMGLTLDLSAQMQGLEHWLSVPIDSLTGKKPPIDWKCADADIKATVNAAGLTHALSILDIKLPKKTIEILNNLGELKIDVQGEGSPSKAEVGISATSACGELDARATMKSAGVTKKIEGAAEIVGLNLGNLLSNNDLGEASGTFDVKGALVGNKFLGNANAIIEKAIFKGYEYYDIKASLDATEETDCIKLVIDDPNVGLDLNLAHSQIGAMQYIDIAGDIEHLNFDKLNIWKKFPEHAFTAKIQAKGNGIDINHLKADVDITGLKYVDASDKGVKIKNISIEANSIDQLAEFDLRSDVLRANMQGKCDFNTIGDELKAMAIEVIPSVWPEKQLAWLEDPKRPGRGVDDNDFNYAITIENTSEISDLFGLPYKIVDPVAINGGVSVTDGQAWATLDAPWLLNGDKLQENTFALVKIDVPTKVSNIYATTLMPTKKGPMDIVIDIDGKGNQLDTNVDWQIIRDIPINGNFNFTTVFGRDLNDAFTTTVDFNPGQINFGEDVWNIEPSSISYTDKHLAVNDFKLITPTQSVVVDGQLSESRSDSLTVTLDNIQLIDIFETLEIDKAMIGGQATGHIYASAVFSDSINIYSPDLFVKDIGYNRCTLGDGDIKVTFDNENKAFDFDAEILEPQGRKSYIQGSLTPATESLDFYFNADHVKVGFMQPFMEAFCSGVSGYASGDAHLYGTFKYIDLEGDIYADSLKLKIDFTNTWYTASDSVHMRPGLIDLKDVTIKDIYGNTAKVNGYVKHTFFKAPVFDFAITDARNFLSYDVTPKESPDWYGRIFGNGGATVNGKPGEVNIGVAMSTAPKSTFTFVLSDWEEASEYSFIAFRDKTPVEIYDSIVGRHIVPKSVTLHKKMQKGEDEEMPTAYNMDIQVDITPQAQMVIVMDPIGGDRIKADGQGHMRMTYGSANNDLRMYGVYTLEHGSYNFTLQDIIIKDFSIREGSSITFTGDPYTAQLDIEAIYSTNANLSDLDESFLQDKDLNRTNVPVNAVLKVTGNMQQPDIAFDLEFPRLNQDVYRKVRSIVSTEDMMNRQIIYLLALNRFYTPEYMASTTKGNELFSVASSTISSQLSSMLGKLSDNWSIAPNLRSDRGDFTDLEVDLMLSSTLLNNRLLFNGNFGYREKMMNTNQFIGDFDIQYLLNPKGSWRLKAYNRFNDQNYYLRTAQTTQGVGIMYRKDFDNMLSFMKKLRKKENNDTIKTEGNSSVELKNDTINAEK